MAAWKRAREGNRIEGRIGTAALTRAVAMELDLSSVVDALGDAASNGPAPAAALMDLATIEQLRGNLDAGLSLQARALAQCQIYETASDAETSLDLLVLAAPIHMGGNTPIEFLVEGSDIRHRTVYLGPDLAVPDPLPAHDIAFVAAPGDTDASRPFLLHIERCLKDWPGPLLNLPHAIMGLERDHLAMTLRGVDGLVLPDTVRMSRAELARIGRGELQPRDLGAEFGFPLVLRPVGSHAGRHLELIEAQAEITGYLDGCDDAEFFASTYIDYRSTDGAFRKYRLVFVNGEPFACHMAIADQWKIWYMNAGMDVSRTKRAEEQRFMQQFDSEFGLRHRNTLIEIARRVDLDYFGIDCAESQDDKLIIFEADNALIVHDMDSRVLFPYKRKQMAKIFAAFVEMLHARARARGPVRPRRDSALAGSG